MKYKQKVLVTGATGFIGSYVCRFLIDSGYQVLGLYRTKTNRIDDLKGRKEFRLIKGELTDFEQILRICKKYMPVGIFHVAALHSPEPLDTPFSYFDSNVKGTLNLLEAARVTGIKKVIYSSSMSVYGKRTSYLPIDEKHPTNPETFYGFTKLLGEECCRFYARQYGMKIIILRYVGTYGRGRHWGAVANFIDNAVQDKALEIDKNVNWDIVYAKDIAEANVSAFEKVSSLGFEVINIGSGRETNILELARLIIRTCNSKSKIKLSDGLSISPSSHFYFNISKARKLLKFKPSPLNKNLKEYLKEINKNR